MLFLNETETLTDIEFISLVKLTESGMINSEDLLNENAIMDKIKEIKEKAAKTKEENQKILDKMKGDKDLENGEKIWHKKAYIICASSSISVSAAISAISILFKENNIAVIRSLLITVISPLLSVSLQSIFCKFTIS